MRILIIRHGDPDYENDTLTEKGKREASFLSDFLADMNIKSAYVSPLGRADLTARIGLSKTDIKPVTCDFLQEFRGVCYNVAKGRDSFCWDLLPTDWMEDGLMFDFTKWRDSPHVAGTNICDEYDKVCYEFDNILEKHGYKRNGLRYDAIKSNRDTIAFFCHFGVESIILSHLINVSPFVLLHNTCALPTSVTSIYSEEREAGIATFRIDTFGGLSHLDNNGEPHSFSARFCETFDSEERHI